jgi:hypothetical protein
LDREADPLELLDEISTSCSSNARRWSGRSAGLNFRGMIDLYTDEFSPGAMPVGGNAWPS